MNDACPFSTTIACIMWMEEWHEYTRPERKILVTRKFILLATAAAVASVPHVAQASCSGNACGAYSAIATWSASEKRVNTVLTNKDQTRPVHLTLCVTVDGKCNSAGRRDGAADGNDPGAAPGHVRQGDENGGGRDRPTSIRPARLKHGGPGRTRTCNQAVMSR
jgi:hypothetical protein